MVAYLTATINYRLAPQHLFPAFVEDVAHAVAHLQGVARQFGGDAERIYLVGHSAGGYCVLQAVLDEQFLRAGRVAPETIRGVAALAAPADFLPLDSPKSIAAFSHWPDLTQTQPITYARKDAPPVLLLHGSQDRTVFTHNSINLAAKLQAAGAIAQYTEYPGVGHVKIMMALAKPLRGQVPVLDDILRFFAAHK
jgi:acetyl esterase/lipase